MPWPSRWRPAWPAVARAGPMAGADLLRRKVGRTLARLSLDAGRTEQSYRDVIEGRVTRSRRSRRCGVSYGYQPKFSSRAQAEFRALGPVAAGGGAGRGRTAARGVPAPDGRPAAGPAEPRGPRLHRARDGGHATCSCDLLTSWPPAGDRRIGHAAAVSRARAAAPTATRPTCPSPDPLPAAGPLKLRPGRARDTGQSRPPLPRRSLDARPPLVRRRRCRRPVVRRRRPGRPAGDHGPATAPPPRPSSRSSSRPTRCPTACG